MMFVQLAVCATVILIAGYKLSHYADIVAEKAGLSRTWVGVVLLAATTSLPELITGITSVRFAGVPDIAAGDVFGSCMFNILIIAMLDLVGGTLPISARAQQGQVLTAGLGIFMLGLAALSLGVGSSMPAVGWIGWNSIISFAVYLAAMRMIFNYEQKRIAEFVEAAVEARHDGISLNRAVAMYALNALFIIAAASYLPYIGDEIARSTGLGQTFVGNIFIAAATSLPEIVVSISALKIGAVDMAVGNVFGSNLFNVAILAIDDVFYTSGPLIAAVSPSHTAAAVGAMTMTAIAVVGLTYRATSKRLLLAWDSWAITAVYLLASVAIYIR
jgi:cation:H+ antiporter